MADRINEAQQSDLREGALERVLGSNEVTLVKKGRSKRAFIVPVEEFARLQADATETRRARAVQAALDDPRASIPWPVVKSELKLRLKQKLKGTSKRTRRASR